MDTSLPSPQMMIMTLHQHDNMRLGHCSHYQFYNDNMTRGHCAIAAHHCTCCVLTWQRNGQWGGGECSAGQGCGGAGADLHKLNKHPGQHSGQWPPPVFVCHQSYCAAAHSPFTTTRQVASGLGSTPRCTEYPHLVVWRARG